MVKNVIKVFLYIFYAFLGLRIFTFVGFPTPTPLFRVFPIWVQKSLAMSYFLIEGRCIFSFVANMCFLLEGTSDRKEGPSFCDSVKP